MAEERYDPMCTLKSSLWLPGEHSWGRGNTEISRASNHGLGKMVAWSTSDDSRDGEKDAHLGCTLKVEDTGTLVGGVSWRGGE